MNRAFRLPSSSPEQQLERRIADGILPRGWIDGLTLANDVSDATNDITIAPGVCRSTVNKAYVYNNAYSTLAKDQRDIEIPDTLTKQLDVAWALGNGGGRSPASLVDDTWHVFAMGGRGLKDSIIIHNSITQSSVLAALPGGYTAYRRIGSLIRATTIRRFTQFGDEFLLKATVTNHSTAVGTSAVLTTLEVPTDIQVIGILSFYANRSGSSRMYFTSPDVDDEAISTTLGRLTAAGVTASGTPESAAIVRVRTNTSGQVRVVSDATQDNTKIATLGWVDFRDRHAA